MRRRTLIGQGLAASTALLAGKMLMSAQPDQPIDALVIGAGLSGLDCAAKVLWVLPLQTKLNSCYPQRAIPQPSDVLLTRWSQDPFAYGSPDA